jgi:hypothetical protein
MIINITLAILQDEIRYAVEEGIENCPGWNPVKTFETCYGSSLWQAAVPFVGRPLSGDEEWFKSNVNYTVDCSKTSARSSPA